MVGDFTSHKCQPHELTLMGSICKDQKKGNSGSQMATNILTQKHVGSVGGGPIRRLLPKSDLSAVWAPKVKACVIGGGGRVVVLALWLGVCVRVGVSRLGCPPPCWIVG